MGQFGGSSTSLGRGGGGPCRAYWYGQRGLWRFQTLGGAPYYYRLGGPSDVDDDNDPATNLDSTVATMTSDIVDAARITAEFVLDNATIDGILGPVQCRATVEAGANARVTTVRYSVTRRNIVTGVETVIIASTSATLNVDGAAARVVTVHMELAGGIYDIDPATDRLIMKIVVWGRQVASVAVPAPIMLWHHRGLDDCAITLTARGVPG